MKDVVQGCDVHEGLDVQEGCDDVVLTLGAVVSLSDDEASSLSFFFGRRTRFF
jgi:hypothetical protein